MPTNEQIDELWDQAESMKDDPSTEWVFAMTIDLVRQQYGVELDNGDIASALAELHG